MVGENSNDAEYEKFKNLLKFFYAQARYNYEAGGVGGVGKLPRNSKSDPSYNVGKHLETCHIPELLTSPLSIDGMRFSIKFASQFWMGSPRSTYISLEDTAVGLYLNLPAKRQYKSGKTDKKIEDFFTWDNPEIPPANLYMGEQYKYDAYNHYAFKDLGLDNDGITEPLKQLYSSLKKFNEDANELEKHEVDDRDLAEPRNWILFGAPGTGKSYKINEALQAKRVKSIPHRRVTFYPDYTYAQFVGTYKPTVSNKEGSITYSFVPGPFITTLIEALNESYTAHVLVVEEINRADPASVFGDVFQLLDRNEEGNSRYPINVDEDLKLYLSKTLNKNGKRALSDALDPNATDDDNPTKVTCNRIVIPGNMYIWATMNSADQGVYPMDTAFKRRWSFKYLPIDTGEADLKKSDNPQAQQWLTLRSGINKLLKEKGRDISEDKLLGSYFLSEYDLSNEDNFKDAFKSKVIMYLFEDAAKYCRDRIFKSSNSSDSHQLYLSDVLTQLNFDEPDLNIFTSSVSENSKGPFLTPDNENEGAASPSESADDSQ